jgi:inner membrane protein CreD
MEGAHMSRSIPAIIMILICTSIAWIILGTTIMARTESAQTDLQSRVASSWGRPQQQTPPSATTSAPLPVEQTRIDTAFNLEQRQKGLLWFATYRVAFRGSWVFRNITDSDVITVKAVFPAPEAVYDDLVFRIDGQPVPFTTAAGAITAIIRRPPGSPFRLDFGYRSQGLDVWQYSFGDGATRVHDFILTLATDFGRIDFPADTLSPTTKQRNGPGWLLTWKYSDVVTGYRIGLVMPQKLQPGPLAKRISYFAPVSLLFFFFLMFVITTLKKIPLHPMHYFFLATSFFAFHLLLAYLVDHISIHAAFAICSAVSIFLVVSYLRIVIGSKFAFREAALAQLVYLVGFSYAFFFQGFTGLAVTIGAILSLFLVMQLTARVQWQS